MKKSLLCLSLGLLMASGVQAQTLYSENFNSTTGTSMPTGWTTDPSLSTAWITGNQSSAGSSSFSVPDFDGRYAIINDDGAGSSADNSNSLMITKSYDFSGQSGSLYASMELAFFAGTYNGITESLTFDASTDGGNTWTTLQTFTGNTVSTWQPYYIDISSYAGQSNVEFAWHYSDGGGWLFGAVVDNFVLFVPQANDIALNGVSPVQGDPGAYGQAGSQITLSGAVFNNGTATITSYTVNYQIGSNAPVSTVESANIASFSADSFSNVNITVPATNGDYPVNVWVTLNGDNNQVNDSAQAFVSSVPFLPTKRLVFEEATGTWCGWCPRGAVGMEDLSSQYPNMATQIAVHNQDPMMNNAYNSVVTSQPGFSGFPSILIDRRMIKDPGDIISLYNTYKNDFGFANVTLGTVSVAGSTVTVPVTVTPAVDINNAKLALIVTESNIRHEDQSNPPSYSDTLWMQHNYYSPQMPGGPNQGGNIQLPLSGFDNAPEYVDGMYYHYVARQGFPSPSGDASGLPATMTANGTYSATLTATLNSSWDTSNLQYDVLLIGSNGAILNSAATTPPILKPMFQDTVIVPESIANVALGINAMELFPNPVSGNQATLSFDMTTPHSNITINIVDITGKVVYSTEVKLTSGNNNVQLPVSNLSSGTYFVTAVNAAGHATIKFVVRK